MKDNKIYLCHIIEAIEKIDRYIKNETLESFMSNDLVVDAVVRELEIIGEAANKVGEEFQEQCSQLPWSQMKGMRNRLIHEYFGVDRKIVWGTCKNDLPSLKNILTQLL